jgi:hypothetical protein
VGLGAGHRGLRSGSTLWLVGVVMLVRGRKDAWFRVGSLGFWNLALYRAMNRLRLYRLLMGTLGITFFLFGVAMVAAFFLYQRPGSTPLIPTGPVGHYFVAFTGCALIAWGGGLVGAAREPMSSRSIGTITAFVLALMAVVRMAAWFIGDYYVWLGDVPRSEASAFLLTSLALVWLRPTVRECFDAQCGDSPSETSAGSVEGQAATTAGGPES